MASLTLVTSTLTSTYLIHKAITQCQTKIEGLDITLDNQTDYADKF